MYPFVRHRVIKHCPDGHVMRMDWLTCPKCTGESPERMEPRREPESAPSREPAPAHRRADARWVLVGIEGAVKGRRIELSGERIKLGKAPAAEDGARIEVLDDPYMSREHMVIERRDDGWHLRDVGSRNGTAVNEERVDEHTLQHGDVIRAGQLALRVEVGSGA